MLVTMAMNPDLCLTLIVAGLLRALLLVYGMWQDSTMTVKYTDVDYYVFSDAAKYVTQGESPYERDTYRYTPLLAWILTPNVWLHSCWGKVLFCVFDLQAGVLIFKLLTHQRAPNTTALCCVQIWLYNPLTVAVSTRGNAESLLAVLVLSTLWLMSKAAESPTALVGAAAVFAVSVHVKIYPITYALPLYLHMAHSDSTGLYSLCPNRRRLAFATVGGTVLLSLTALCYYCYGWKFLEETYLYHVTRKDTRHNFSPYFYLLYIADNKGGVWLGLLAFVPQLVLLIIASFKFHRDLAFSCFLNTAIFVTFNKVCTSQYFLWFLCLMPLLIPYLQISRIKAIVMTTAWFIGQGLWLLPAYYLEFEGQNTFLFVWLAGLLFYLINIAILCQIVAAYPYDSAPSCQRQIRKTNNLCDIWTFIRKSNSSLVKRSE